MFEEELPKSLIERVSMMEGILIAAATGGSQQNPVYQSLRSEFMANHEIKDLLPSFVRTYRNLDAFWPFIKHEAGTYAERRQIISTGFTPLLDRLEDLDRSPGDQTVSDALHSFIGNVTKNLKKGNKVSFVGFGTFSVSKRKARVGRNPQTGAKIDIPATKVPHFKAGKSLKEAVKK
jgi:nucleoid DNA-binding protein